LLENFGVKFDKPIDHIKVVNELTVGGNHRGVQGIEHLQLRGVLVKVLAELKPDGGGVNAVAIVEDFSESNHIVSFYSYSATSVPNDNKIF
jgi:hypothetical protein